MTTSRSCVVGLVIIASIASGAAHAGRPCEEKPHQVADVQQAMALAQKTAQRLDASGAQVVMLARVGQDLGRYGLSWSHFGYAYRESPTSPWRVVHKLNHCGTATSAIYRQGLGEFFLDGMHRYEAGIVVLSPAVQERLLPLLRDDARAVAWHAEPYNMLAYPWSTQYQQSNQWAIETLAGAMDPAVRGRPQAQAWLQLHDYRPTTLKLGAMTRLGARATRANIAFDDHPNDKRFSDRIETVTVDSVFAWVQRDGLGGPVQRVQ